MNRTTLSLLGAIALFVAGWWAARAASSAEGDLSEGKQEAARNHRVPTANAGEGNHNDRSTALPRMRIPQEVMIALQGAAPSRTPALLSAIEKMSASEFTPEWAAAIDKVLKGGDTEECQYVFSLMEQREEAASVNYLVKQLDHENEDIRDRALMACEAVAGQVFGSADQAKAWAKSWTPDPEKQVLFSNQLQPEGASISSRPGQRPKRSSVLPSDMPAEK